MIRISRDPDPPTIRIYTEASTRSGGMEPARYEREQAILFFENAAHFAGNAKLTKATFPFKIYKDATLAARLEAVFGKKCAYCESRFAHVTPKDIEHFRPKSEVRHRTGSLVPGYYWLAGEWSNLLVSCPDCNRSRKHPVPGQSGLIRLGKETQFPLRDEALRARCPSDPLDREEGARLLLHPCLDDPEAHLTYDERGLIQPRPDAQGAPSEMGMASIDVYALQRKALVEERMLVLNEVKFDLESIRKLLARYSALQAVHTPPALLAELLEDLKRYRDHLKARCEASAPYLGMLRDYIRRTKADGGFGDLIQNGVDPETLL